MRATMGGAGGRFAAGAVMRGGLGKGVGGGIGRGIGGLLGATTGALGTPVRVTNWPASLGPTASMGAATGRRGVAPVVAGGRGVRAFPWKTAGVGVGLGLTSYGLGRGAEALEERGYVKTAGAASIGAGLAGVGSGIAMGMAIGSFVPVIGTALGGVTGGAIAAFTQWENLAGGFEKLFGETEQEKKEREKARLPEMQKS